LKGNRQQGSFSDLSLISETAPSDIDRSLQTPSFGPTNAGHEEYQEFVFVILK
jgi:hypothetical protein